MIIFTHDGEHKKEGFVCFLFFFFLLWHRPSYSDSYGFVLMVFSFCLFPVCFFSFGVFMHLAFVPRYLSAFLQVPRHSCSSDLVLVAPQSYDIGIFQFFCFFACILWDILGIDILSWSGVNQTINEIKH